MNITIYIRITKLRTQVQKIDIAYSKTAKKIDVKKVKKAMWNIMSMACEADKVRYFIKFYNKGPEAYEETYVRRAY